jgi:phosphonate transport system permease protein
VAEFGFRQNTVAAKIERMFDQQGSFMVLTLAFFVLLWVLNVWDAYRSTRDKQRARTGVFLAVLGLFFVLGWQISEINLVRMAREAPEAVDPLARVLWPWEAAITYDQDSTTARHPVRVVAEGEESTTSPPESPEREEGEPYIEIDPAVGHLSRQASDGDIVHGTTTTVEGFNFKPNTETRIWWVDAIQNEFRVRQRGEYVNTTTNSQGEFSVEVIMPYRITPSSAQGPQIHYVEARQTAQVGPPLPSEPLRLTIGRMIETIFMGMMATLFGIIFAIPVSFLAARNIMNGSWVTLLIYYLARTVMNIVRSIEPLIWALIAVVWVGLGPFAGIIALTIHSIAALAKLYSEAIEGIDHGPIEAIRATGANGMQTIAYAVIPQMISPFISFSIYRWDINVRMSTVIGLVGGGGIGYILIQYIRLLDYTAAGIAVWFIAVTVAILDYVSAEIRARLM